MRNKFEKMLGMEYFCPGIGNVRLMVGVRLRDKTKIQYCITALTPVLRVKGEEKTATNDVTVLFLPRGNVLELLLESGHRWRGFAHVRKPILRTFYFLGCKGK